MIPLEGRMSDTRRQSVVNAVLEFMRAHQLSQADVADGVGQSATYISNVLNDSDAIPAATRERILRDINNWMEREVRAREAERPGDFVETRPAERLIALAAKLTTRADMAIAYGPAGIGKSTTVQAIVAEIPTAFAIDAGIDTSTPNKLLRVLIGATTRKRSAAYPLTMEALVNRLRMPAGVKTRNLVIIDQAHELPARCLRVLMELHNRAGCSILLVGTIDLRSLVSTDDDPEYGQLASRVGMRINLAPELAGTQDGARVRGKCFTVADIRKLFGRAKLKLHPDAAQMLCQVANGQRGTLRRVMRLFDWAEAAAQHAGDATIQVKHLRIAGALVERESELPVPVPAADAAAAAG